MTDRTFTFPDGRTVARMGFGAMRLTGQPRNFGPYADWPGGVALLRRAAELGVQHLDTARAYGPHHNERLQAEALAPFAGRVFVATKVDVEKDADAIRRDGRPETLARHVVESRDALAPLIGEGPIDLVYLHQPDPETPIAESVAALEAERRAGRIARIGVRSAASRRAATASPPRSSAE